MKIQKIDNFQHTYFTIYYYYLYRYLGIFAYKHDVFLKNILICEPYYSSNIILEIEIIIPFEYGMKSDYDKYT